MARTLHQTCQAHNLPISRCVITKCCLCIGAERIVLERHSRETM